MIRYTKMDPVVKERWVFALRGEHYRKGTLRLRHNGKFCCFGVLCDLVDPDGWDEYHRKDFKQQPVVEYLHRGCDTIPSKQVRDAAGIKYEVMDQLAFMNDNADGGSSFPEIADWIEVNL